MKRNLYLLLLISFIGISSSNAQNFLDSCFASTDTGRNFLSSNDLADVYDADLLGWTGTKWLGQWSAANITTPPPCPGVGQRAIFIGDDSVWTTGGELFALQFSQPLVIGTSYTFTFTTVSAGLGSNGAFAPLVTTNDNPSENLLHTAGNLSPTGYSWASSHITFTATAAQSGDNWIIIHSQRGSGLVLNFCCSSTTASPAAQFISNKQSICQNDCISFSDQSSNSPTTWQWTFTGGTPSMSNLKNPPQVCYNTSGNYNVKLVVSNAGGKDSITKITYIEVNQLPDAGNITSQKDTICPNTVAHLNVSGNSGSLQWQSSGSASGGFTSITGATAQAYNEALSLTSYFRTIANNGTCSDTSTVFTQYVAPSPVATFWDSVSGHQVSFYSGAGSQGETYSWDFGDSTRSTDADPVHDYANSGVFHVCLTVRNNTNCDETLCKYLTIYPLGINNLINTDGLSIYPDPFNDNVYLKVNDANGKTESIVIYDLLGREVFNTKPINMVSNQIRLDLSSLANGMYYFKIRMNGNDYVQKIIKQ